MNTNSLRETLRKQIYALAEEAKQVMRLVLESERGLNKKVGKNTLINSNLYNELNIAVSENMEIISLLVNDYIIYIESGRKPGTWPPPQIIADWCQRKGLPSDNSTVYLICRSIFEEGIAPRPIFDGTDGVWERIDRYWEDWAEMIFNTLTEQLDEYFND